MRKFEGELITNDQCEQKRLKAYLRGHEFYNWKGMIMFVGNPETKKRDVMLDAMKKNMNGE